MADPKSNPDLGTKYAVAVAFVVLIGIVCFLVVAAQRPSWDKLLIVGGLMGSLSPLTFSLFSFMKGEETRTQSVQTYMQVNGRFDQYKADLRAETDRLVREAYGDGLKKGMETLVIPPTPISIVAPAPNAPNPPNPPNAPNEPNQPNKPGETKPL